MIQTCQSQKSCSSSSRERKGETCVRATHVSEVCMVKERERKKEMCVYVCLCVYVRACKEDVCVWEQHLCVHVFGYTVRCCALQSVQLFSMLYRVVACCSVLQREQHFCVHIFAYLHAHTHTHTHVKDTHTHVNRIVIQCVNHVSRLHDFR